MRSREGPRRAGARSTRAAPIPNHIREACRCLRCGKAFCKRDASVSAEPTAGLRELLREGARGVERPHNPLHLPVNDIHEPILALRGSAVDHRDDELHAPLPAVSAVLGTARIRRLRRAHDGELLTPDASGAQPTLGGEQRYRHQREHAESDDPID